MKILLLLKTVADSEASIRPTSDGKAVALSDINLILNPYDEYAVEEALQIREKTSDAEITALCYGDESAIKTLRTALALGVEKGVHIKGQPGFDSLTTAKILAAAIKDMEYDLILCGKQAIDDDSSSVGVMVAELLDIPNVSVVVKLDITDGKVQATREIEGGHEIVETKMPCLISAQKGLNEPRYPSLKGIMAAKKKPIDEKDASAAETQIEVLRVEAPASRNAGKIVGEGEEAVPELVRLLKEEAKVL
ncbi:electron transfer flavoprotein subunit beta/FixA family protein [bacterium]|nr:electron transfer flavoprotein subunit beta/FixA family protein [bacterium]